MINDKLKLEWLNGDNPYKEEACRGAVTAWQEKFPNGSTIKEAITALKKAKRYDWLNWFLTRNFTQEQNVKYAIYAAEQVIDIFEKEYPEDKRPRQAIEASKAWLANPTEENRQKCRDAYASISAAIFSISAPAAAPAAVYDSVYDSVPTEMQLKICNYGIEILKGGGK